MVSIIVPVYNAEAFIEDAIRSVLNQTYKNIELLLINDGSKDNSASICKRYAEKNQTIKFYDKMNEGVSKTRNFGIDHAQGDYVCFLDADDTLPNDAIETLVRAANSIECDVVYANHCNVYGEKKVPRLMRVQNGLYSYADLKEKLLDDGTLTGILFGSVGGACYRAQYLKEYNIHFRTNVRVNEDGLFNMEVITSCNVVKVIDDVVYNYRQWKNSKRVPLHKDERFVDSELEIAKFIKETGELHNFEVQLKRRKVSVAFWHSLRVQNSDTGIKDNYRYLKEIFNDVELKNCYLSLDYENMNIYKKTLCLFMRHKLVMLFYVSVRYFSPILAKIIKR